MAKVKFTAVVADMRNKLNGSVFSRNRAGAYVRTKVTPVNPSSPDQSIARSRLANLSSTWRSLTDAQRASWNNGAEWYPKTDQFGDTYLLAGNSIYVMLNTNLLTAGQSTTDTFVAPGEMPEFQILSGVYDISATTLNITFTDVVPAGFICVVQATQPVSAGRAFVKNMYRQITTLDNTAPNPALVGTAYTAKFGSFTSYSTGQKIGVKVFLIDTITGKAGVPSEILVTMVP